MPRTEQKNYREKSAFFLGQKCSFVFLLRLRHSGLKTYLKYAVFFRECVSGDQGKKLQQKDADRTENTWPDWSESVPWVIFNNLSLSSLQPDIIDTKSALCIFYFNRNKLEACK